MHSRRIINKCNHNNHFVLEFQFLSLQNAKHWWKKREQLQLRQMYWLLASNFELSIHNKLLLNRQIIKPVWINDIQLWGCTKKSNRKIVKIKYLETMHEWGFPSRFFFDKYFFHHFFIECFFFIFYFIEIFFLIRIFGFSTRF